MSLGSILRACRPRSLSRIPHCRYFSTDPSDRNAGNSDKFGWMDRVLESAEINDVSGSVKLEEHHWDEFVNTGFITETEDVLEEPNDERHAVYAQEISQKDVRGWLDIDGDDLSQMFDGANVDFKIGEFDNRESVPHDSTEQEAFSTNPFEFQSAQQRAPRIRRLNNRPRSMYNERARLLSLEETLKDNFPKLPDIETNKKKPGKEKRVMRQENEMGRIIENLISTRFTEWNKFEATITQVVLSPNMQNLTVFYHVPGDEQRTTKWKKLIKNITRSSRAEIAKLHSRYAPKVRFCYGRTQDEDGLEGIFDQIAKERQEASKQE